MDDSHGFFPQSEPPQEPISPVYSAAINDSDAEPATVGWPAFPWAQATEYFGASAALNYSRLNEDQGWHSPTVRLCDTPQEARKNRRTQGRRGYLAHENSSTTSSTSHTAAIAEASSQVPLQVASSSKLGSQTPYNFPLVPVTSPQVLQHQVREARTRSGPAIRSNEAPVSSVQVITNPHIILPVPSQPPWDCPYANCPNGQRPYSYKSALERHIKSQHLDIRAHVCDKCGSSFARADVLKKKHWRTCQGTPSLKYLNIRGIHKKPTA